MPRAPAQPRAKRGTNDEAIAQGAIIAWLRTVGFPDALHCPNGGQRNPREASRLKWQGVLAGVPDIIVPLPGGRVMWLEVKAPPRWGLRNGKPAWLPAGKLAAEQKDFRDRRIADGGIWAVVTSIVETRIALAENGIATREAK